MQAVPSSVPVSGGSARDRRSPSAAAYTAGTPGEKPGETERIPDCRHIGPFHGGCPHRGTVRRIVSVCGKYLRDDMQAGTGGQRTCLAEGSGGIGKHPGLRDRRDHPRQNEGDPGDRSRRRLHDVRFHAAVRSAVIMQIKKGQRASEPSDLSFLLKHLPVNQGERVDQCDMVASQA